YTAMAALFPLDFRECCSSVAGVVVVEQVPSWAFGSRRGVSRDRYRFATGNKPAHIRSQPLEITALVGEGRRPSAHWSVTGNHTLRGDGAKFFDGAQPAANAAIQHGRVGEKHEVAREQRSGLLIKHSEVVVAVR